MRKIIFFFFICLIPICVQAQEVEIVQDTIPFRNDLGIIIIPISFNGVEKQFAFDTGAQKSVAFSWARKELKRTSKRISVRSSNGSRTKMRLYKSGTINLASRKITEHVILTIDDSPIFSCHNIDGILGVDIMKHFNWKIDYKSQHLILYEKDHFPAYVDTMSAMEFAFKNDRPSVYGNSSGGKIKFLLDTGASDSDLKKENYKITNLDKIPSSDLYTGFYDVKGDLTQAKSLLIQFPALTSKDVKFTPVFEYANTKSKIGNTLWKDKTLFMSLSSQRLLVSEATLLEDVRGYDCGIVFYNGKMRIGTIHTSSDAWVAGARQGDEVVKVNNKSFTDFCSFDTYQRGITTSGADFTIELKNGKTITVKKEIIFKTAS